MTPLEKLVQVLETLSPEDRRELTTWLLGRTVPLRASSWMVGQPDTLTGLTGTLPAGEGSQLVTIRLNAERHAELRDWCTEHGFTMAAVVRGLVERFLEEQRGGK